MEAETSEQNIAMWGPSGSGKTTFLAALSIALRKQGGSWKVVGADDPSTTILTKMTRQLATEKVFPRLTQGIHRYNWFLLGESHKMVGRFRKKQETTHLRISLDLVDPSGEYFAGDRISPNEALVENLIKSRGIVWLFDPVREYEEGDAFDSLHTMLDLLSTRMLVADELEDGRLPHFLAVCVTKFDEYRVLNTAEKMQLATVDPDDEYEFPRVSTEDAKELFSRLCGVSADGDNQLITNTLDQYFQRDRIQYFVTSAIGFYVNPSVGVYDPDDFSNLIETQQGSRIRGPVHPIQVMEPMLWLGQRLAAEG